jgi:short-subunit dehydrogenase
VTDIPRKALVTGASSGLGAEFSRQLASQCDEIILTGRQRQPLAALADELEQQNIKTRIEVADLATTTGIAQLVETIRQQGPLDYLVNNAGFTTVGPYMEQHPASQEAMVSLHINATMQLTLAALGGMSEQKRGSIINVSSLASLAPFASVAVYSGTKSFLNAFSEALQQEVRSQGVKIQSLCPGYIRTAFHTTSYFDGFDAASVPDEYWMEAGEVVSQSLAALRRDDNPVIVVPGANNRAMARAALEKQLQQVSGD